MRWRRQILADLDEAQQVLSQARLQPTRRLRIDLPTPFGRLKIVPLLGRSASPIRHSGSPSP